MKRRIVLSLVSVVVAFFLVKMIYEQMHKGNVFPAVRPFMQLAFPKKDLFFPLASVPIQLEKKGSEVSVAVSHKYAGDHSISIVVKNAPPIADKDAMQGRYLDYKVVVECVDSGNVVFKRTVNKTGSAWWRQKEAGFTILNYSVPQDLPLDHSATCKLVVLEPGKLFSQHYGSQTVQFSKASEK